MMKIAATLWLATCIIFLDTSNNVDAQGGRSSMFSPCRNVRCRRGFYCVPRAGIGVCVRRPFLTSCLQPLRIGPCTDYTRRYFYNRFLTRCQPFIYGGCGGNQNNFYTWGQCYGRCVRRPWYGTKPIQPAIYNMNIDP